VSSRERFYWQLSRLISMVVAMSIIVGIWVHAAWVMTPWTLLAFVIVGGWGAWASIVLKFNRIDKRKAAHTHG
jgi:uncharacterized membrane protein